MIDNKQTPQEITSLKMMQTRQKLYELITQLRKDASSVHDPNARILLDFSAEMIADIVHALRQYEENIKNVEAKTNKETISKESSIR